MGHRAQFDEANGEAGRQALGSGLAIRHFVVVRVVMQDLTPLDIPVPAAYISVGFRQGDRPAPLASKRRGGCPGSRPAPPGCA